MAQGASAQTNWWVEGGMGNETTFLLFTMHLKMNNIFWYMGPHPVVLESVSIACRDVGDICVVISAYKQDSNQ